MRRLVIIVCLILASGFTLVTPAQADAILSVDQIRQARQQGHIRPLRWIMAQLKNTYPGRLLKAKVIQRNGRYLYTLGILQPNSYLIRLVVDANTAQILKARTRPTKSRKH